jgi:ribonuclease HI
LGQAEGEDEDEDAPSESAARGSELHLPQVEIYARGCALGNPGLGGYAAVLVPATTSEHPRVRPRVVSGAWPLTTNNVMELWAAVAALQALRQRSQVTLFTTSKYVLDGATRWLAQWETRGWHTKEGHPVKNQEVWQELTRAMGDHDITWKALSGGSRDPHSQRAADEARRAADELRAKQAHG